MSKLNIASKADQSSTLPAVLIATYAKKCDNTAIVTINFEDVDTLKTNNKASVEFSQGNGTSIYGSMEAIAELISAHPALQGRNESIVSADHQYRRRFAIDGRVGSRMAYKDSFFLPYRLQSRRSIYA